MHRLPRPWQPVLAMALILIVALASPSLARKKKDKNPPGTLDDGTLVMSWFGNSDLRFVEADEIDYLWVKDGFSAKGRTLQFEPWGDPDFQGPEADERDSNDRRLARQMTAEMARSFQEEWGRILRGVDTSLDSGDIQVEGRIVDCSTGNRAAKMLVGFGAGAGYTTIDVKLTDKSSGELLVAFHHRVVSGTSWSTTDSKFHKWIGKFAKAVRDAGGFAELYDDGDTRKK